MGRNGARVCPTGAPDLPDRGHDLLYGGDECNEFGLKFSPDYYLSTTVEYPVQIFSSTGRKIFPRWGAGPPGSPSGATPADGSTTPQETFLEAAGVVMTGCSLRTAAGKYEIYFMTLQRYSSEIKIVIIDGKLYF
ncbi:hypothetical protein AVEN_71371-1 [Araneus ventricosus]|uniref:Uncharacterized protein n=1 Tax=Araneus ventricosus TaxID=182803 RepID=A0A4Y2BHJ8_ARAVE|nr:hypothetical protein AVEN_71371-1 [Araneus ventricosus]